MMINKYDNEKERKKHYYTMLNITNRKISALDVRWAPFQGFSILFNNPGSNCFRARHSGVFDLVNGVHHDPSLNFYKILQENITHLDVDSLTKRFLFFSLSPTSYHVTLWGGLNCRYITRINPEYRSTVENWLLTLPDSFVNIPKEIIEFSEVSSLCTKRDWNINFRFNGLNIWNDSVLVATLRPDDDSISKFEELAEERRHLNKQYHDRFHVFTDSDIYKPHVSLGYFANEEGAQKAVEFLDQWNISFVEALRDQILSFNNASIFGFTDMITFFKREDI